MAKVFVSYSHRRGEWVWDRLVPVLRAGGAEVLIDRERFKAGRAVVGQMDAIQDQAERHVLCLGADYLASDYCRHEMERAMGRDPVFERGIVLPVRLDDAPLPVAIAIADPLHVDLRDDGRDLPWASLLDGCGAGLGMAAPTWLAARDDVVRYLERGRSVNLVVVGDHIAWRPLIREVAERHGARVALEVTYGFPNIRIAI